MSESEVQAMSQLELELREVIRSEKYAGTQQAEVALRFLSEASRMRQRGDAAGADRKVRAAHCVLTGECVE